MAASACLPDGPKGAKSNHPHERIECRERAYVVLHKRGISRNFEMHVEAHREQRPCGKLQGNTIDASRAQTGSCGQGPTITRLIRVI
jgi:hypothetical protein